MLIIKIMNHSNFKWWHIVLFITVFIVFALFFYFALNYIIQRCCARAEKPDSQEPLLESQVLTNGGLLEIDRLDGFNENNHLNGSRPALSSSSSSNSNVPSSQV